MKVTIITVIECYQIPLFCRKNAEKIWKAFGLKEREERGEICPKFKHTLHCLDADGTPNFEKFAELGAHLRKPVCIKLLNGTVHQNRLIEILAFLFSAGKSRMSTLTLLQ